MSPYDTGCVGKSSYFLELLAMVVLWSDSYKHVNWCWISLLYCSNSCTSLHFQILKSL